MAQVEEALRIRHFEHSPSPQEFISTIEPRNVPAVFHGAVKDWAALSKWSPASGGLDYLQDRVGSADVEAMRSKSAPIFYGDLRSHERVPLLFASFITSCKMSHQSRHNRSFSFIAQEDSVEASASSEESCSTSVDSPDQLYLAQVPIMSSESKERSALHILRDDIQTPVFLAKNSLTSINLWMNMSRSRSSTHYDPYHNLLCVVVGSKQVSLWPPSACRLLYPMPIYGEATNHSAVDIESPDFSVHVRAKDSIAYSQKITLHSGDALFIPEGWFHQVDSDDLTIAVNFWWKSDIMLNMLEHMDAYYLRRIVNRLVEKEMNHLLHKSLVNSSESRENCDPMDEASKGHHDFDSNQHVGDVKENGKKPGLLLHQLEPLAINVLYELVSLVHDTVKGSGQSETGKCASSNDSLVNPQGECKQTAPENSSIFETDPVAGILRTIEPLVLQKVLHAMVHHFPRTLEALFMHVLSPTAAEILTRKFDEMDKQTGKEQQTEFYQLLYSVFDDPYAAMDAILNKKESFAFQAVQNVFDHFLGLHVDKPK